MRRPPLYTLRWSSAALAAALTGLVAAGSATGVDQWAVDRLMPGTASTASSPSLLDSLFPIFDPGKEHGHVALAAATYAVVWIASVAPSILLVGFALLVLWRRRAPRTALLLGASFVIANAIEVIGKAVITRPALYAHSGGAAIHVTPFDDSFPSGHELRAVFLAACLAVCVRKLWPVAAAWLAAVTVMLVVGGWHTPTDVLGGLLIAVVFVAEPLVPRRYAQ
ncbi:MAG TPA: phosphatase PAP2 family protein [Gaiellaceae bacterium]|nr:phosphatase PAP2 family protein [Gaiellaceae bacterium]